MKETSESSVDSVSEEMDLYGYSRFLDDEYGEEVQSSVGSCFPHAEGNLKRKRRGSDLPSGEEEDQPCGSDTQAEPLIRYAWTGDFWSNESIYHRRIYTFDAFLSIKACKKARGAAADMESMQCFEMVQKARVWPKSFRRSAPTGDDIALYFFPPSETHEGVYDLLVAEMIRDDLGMRVLEQKEWELLIFTSIELPFRCQKFKGKHYLWGVFKGKKVLR